METNKNKKYTKIEKTSFVKKTTLEEKQLLLPKIGLIIAAIKEKHLG